ncbi:MAG: transcriptional regulator [Acidiferrobacteraceae bacterium]|nr:transcriptional regulator [Acidiferrobacteraceae bacterium]|tara:strand:+ start:11047 stop:11361 length:315 start_codon:yes stop_codon:yes gene_type:complete
MSLNTKKAVEVFAGLAHDRRLEIFRHLVRAGYNGASPSAIQEELTVSASTLSFHLKNLRSTDLISVKREGRKLIYCANFDLMDETIGYLVKNCCTGHHKIDTKL